MLRSITLSLVAASVLALPMGANAKSHHATTHHATRACELGEPCADPIISGIDRRWQTVNYMLKMQQAVMHGGTPVVVQISAVHLMCGRQNGDRPVRAMVTAAKAGFALIMYGPAGVLQAITPPEGQTELDKSCHAARTAAGPTVELFH